MKQIIVRKAKANKNRKYCRHCEYPFKLNKVGLCERCSQRYEVVEVEN